MGGKGKQIETGEMDTNCFAGEPGVGSYADMEMSY